MKLHTTGPLQQASILAERVTDSMRWMERCDIFILRQVGIPISFKPQVPSHS